MRPRALFVAASALAVAAVAPPARADFDPATGTVRPSADGASFVGFEPAERPPLRVATLRAGALPTLEAGALDALRVAASLQGSSALRVPAGKAVIVGDAATFAALGDARVEVRVWARADGARPSARLVYAPGEIEPRDLSFPNASVDAVETGRATSDGWVEYSTGPVDATIGARTRAAGIVLEADASPLASSGFWVDAVEVRRVGAKPARGACTLATEDAACGAEGACVEGSCVDGAAVWGPLPSLEQRRAIVERQEQYLVRFTSDRAGATNAAARFSPVARAAAESATTARTFWQPFHRSAAEARGAHTRAVGPAHYHRLAWHVATYTRSVWNELLACFGAVERDLTGGGRGIAVFQAAPTSPVRVGDLVERIDGEEPAAWLARTIPIASLSSDPDVDGPLQASNFQEIVTALARTLEVRRCASATACTGASSTVVTVDLAELRKNVLSLPFQTQPKCSVRFKRAVTIPAGADPEAYEAAFESVDADGTAHVLTNGEPPGPDLAAVVNRAFDRAPAKMIVDKRRGDGGGGDSLAVWAERVRQDGSFRLLTSGRWSYDAIDPPSSVFAELAGCDSDRPSLPVCWGANASWSGIPARGIPRPAKVAWLNIVDGSASDLATTYAKGVPGVRIFGPARTMGLFGGLQHVPRFGSGLSDGYIQRGDTRIGSTWAAVTAAPWQSGRGIEPDERVVQSHADVLADKDTMLDRAKAWLAE